MNYIVNKTATLCVLLLMTFAPHISFASSQGEEEEVQRSFVPFNLRKDLPSFGDATYGCKKVQANPNGAGCFLDNEWTTWTYTPPTSSSSSTTTGFVPSTTTGSGN